MESLKLIRKYVKRIDSIDPCPICEEMKSKLTTECGVYMFIRKRSRKVDYVGTATGANGLKQRIKQHLSISYDKSVFRIKLGKDKMLNSLDDQVRHLEKHYLISYIPVKEHKSIIMAIEQVLIYEKKSIYNDENIKSKLPNFILK